MLWLYIPWVYDSIVKKFLWIGKFKLRFYHEKVLEWKVLNSISIHVIYVMKWGIDVRIEVPTFYSLISFCLEACDTRIWMEIRASLCKPDTTGLIDSYPQSDRIPKDWLKYFWKLSSSPARRPVRPNDWPVWLMIRPIRPIDLGKIINVRFRDSFEYGLLPQCT